MWGKNKSKQTKQIHQENKQFVPLIYPSHVGHGIMTTNTGKVNIMFNNSAMFDNNAVNPCITRSTKVMVLISYDEPALVLPVLPQY